MTNEPINLCKNCANRIRRVFIPQYPNNEINEYETSEACDEEANLFIMNHCLVLDISTDLEYTIECSHFKQKEKGSETSLLQHDLI